MLKSLLPDNIYNIVCNNANLNSLTEIRLRLNSPLSLAMQGKYYAAKDSQNNPVIVSKTDIDYVIGIATQHSVYAVNEQLAYGFLSYRKGIRIGVCGHAVYKNNKLFTIKDINSLCIRVPHQIDTIAKNANCVINDFDNCIIISPPGYGKTTLLRNMIKELSIRGNNILVIDERNELSAISDGVKSLDLGPNTDVLVYADKQNGYIDAVRAMRPDIIATDEIFGKTEIECLCDINRSGVKFLATIHGKNLKTLLKNKMYAEIATFTRYFIELGEFGTITKITDKEDLKQCYRL